MDFSISNVFSHFTPITWAIAIVLLVMSVLSLTVAFNRGLTFARSRKQSKQFAADTAVLLQKQNVDAVLKASKADEYKFAYLARIVETGLSDARDVKAKLGALEDLTTVESAMGRAVASEGVFLKKWMTILATVSSTAPFVGLLGTVFGIINSFAGMAATGSGGLGAVAGGIAEALVMTGFGLVVAIPAVWLYNWANAHIEGFTTEMQTNASEVLDWIRKNKAAI